MQTYLMFATFTVVAIALPIASLVGWWRAILSGFAVAIILPLLYAVAVMVLAGLTHPPKGVGHSPVRETPVKTVLTRSADAGVKTVLTEALYAPRDRVALRDRVSFALRDRAARITLAPLETPNGTM